MFSGIGDMERVWYAKDSEVVSHNDDIVEALVRFETIAPISCGPFVYRLGRLILNQ